MNRRKEEQGILHFVFIAIRRLNVVTCSMDVCHLSFVSAIMVFVPSYIKLLISFILQGKDNNARVKEESRSICVRSFRRRRLSFGRKFLCVCVLQRVRERNERVIRSGRCSVGGLNP